tara:strand:- start:752 stop:2191 length:1440 start_codon:yes stop_codon:yes gene_type:complete
MGYKQGKNPFSKSPLNFSSPLNSFDSLVGKLMNQGKSKEAATKIAGKVANAKMKGAGSGPTAAQKARSKGSAAKMADESPLDKELVGNQKNLPDHLKNAIEAAPESPAKMKSPIKAHGKKLKALEKRIEKVRKSKEGSEGQGGIDYELLSELEAQKKQMIESHAKQAKETKDSPAKMKDSKTGKSHSEMSDKEKGKHMGQHQGKGKRRKPIMPPPEASAKTRLEKSGVKAKDSPAKNTEEKPHGTYADQGYIKSYKKGNKYVAIDKSEHDSYQDERVASGQALTRAGKKARKAKGSPAKEVKPIGDHYSGNLEMQAIHSTQTHHSQTRDNPGHNRQRRAEILKSESDARKARKEKENKPSSEGNKKKSPLNNAYENPQYIQPTKSSYGQDMDNFFNTVDNAFSEANTPEARSERNTRRSKIIEDKLADSPNDEKLKKKSDRLAAERVGIDSRIASQSFDVDNLSNEDLNNLYEAIKNRK